MTEGGAGLPVRERAYAVAAVRVLGARAEPHCARRPVWGGALRRFAALLHREPALLDAEALRLDRPIPSGLDEIHPSWFVAPPASSRPELTAWLARSAYGHLVDHVPAPGGAPAPVLGRLAELDAATLGELLLQLGRRRVATAFSGAPRAALAQLCARLGEPAASDLLRQVRAMAREVDSDEVKAAQRALFTLGVDDAAQLFLRAGCAFLGPALQARGGDRVRRVAQRLPRPLGEALLRGAAEPATEAEQAQAVGAAAALLGSMMRP